MSVKCHPTVTVITFVLLSVQSVIIVSLVDKYTNSKLLLNYCSAEMKLLSNYNRIYREKRIPMTALWCPAFSNHG